MCRARPGPRCSHGGKIRINRAEKYLAQAMQSEYSAIERSKDGSIPERVRLRVDNAHRRYNAAKRVFLSTPEGVRQLTKRIESARERLDTLPKGSARSPERDQYNVAARTLRALEKDAERATGARHQQYLDLHLVKGDVAPGYAGASERRRTRDASATRGGTVNRLGQPKSNAESYDEKIAADRTAALNLREWEDEDYARARSWVEEGSFSPWTESPYARPAAGAGTALAPAQVRTVRLNTPDGQIVEGRADVHLTKRDDKFIVSERLTVASTWEDASPIDVTTQALGEVLASKRGVNRKNGQEVKEFSTQADAEAYIKKSKNRLNQTFVSSVARMGREALIGRSKKTHEPLQKRGFVVWPRYLGSGTAAA